MGTPERPGPPSSEEDLLARARALGVRVVSPAATDSLLAAGRLVQLKDSTQQWIVRRGTSPAHVVPHLRTLLDVFGGRFQERLAGMGLPPYQPRSH